MPNIILTYIKVYNNLKKQQLVNRKRHFKLMGLLYAIGAMIFTVLMVSGELDSMGIGLGIVFTLVFMYKAYDSFKEMKQSGEGDKLTTAYGPFENASTEEKISYYKRILWIGIPAFAILSAWVWYDLSSLETGSQESVSVWAPVSFIYDNGGFWPAVLATPVLGVAVFIALQFAIRKLRMENR